MKLADELWATAIAATMLGAFVRLAFVLSVNFPVNDGGMFYAMVRDLQEANYQLPAFTSYNDAGIPYAYPLLMFYVAAALNDVTGISLLTLFRVLPLVGSILTIPAFFLVSRNLLKNRFAVEISVIAFALIPRSFMWMIGGGGLTRSWGLLFALLALHQATRLLLHNQQRAWPLVGLFAGLAVLSHLEMAIFFTVGYAVLLFFSPRDRLHIGASVRAAAAGAVVVTPWLGWLAANGQLSALVDAATAGTTSAKFFLRLVDPAVFDEPLFPVALVLAVVGAVAVLRDGDRMLPVWVLVLFLLDPRKAPTHATVPVAMLVGTAAARVLLPTLARPASAIGVRERRVVVYGITGVMTITALLSHLGEGSALETLSADGQEVLERVNQSTDPTARFVVVDGRDWARDSLSEWFPALTGRRSLATAQGYEWFGGDRFVEQQDVHHQLQLCGDIDARCLDEWSAETGLAFSHVFVASAHTFDIVRAEEGGCCEGLRRSLAGDSRYRVVFEGRGGTIFERVR